MIKSRSACQKVTCAWAFRIHFRGRGSERLFGREVGEKDARQDCFWGKLSFPVVRLFFSYFSYRLSRTAALTFT